VGTRSLYRGPPAESRVGPLYGSGRETPKSEISTGLHHNVHTEYSIIYCTAYLQVQFSSVHPKPPENLESLQIQDPPRQRLDGGHRAWLVRCRNVIYAGRRATAYFQGTYTPAYSQCPFVMQNFTKFITGEIFNTPHTPLSPQANHCIRLKMTCRFACRLRGV